MVREDVLSRAAEVKKLREEVKPLKDALGEKVSLNDLAALKENLENNLNLLEDGNPDNEGSSNSYSNWTGDFNSKRWSVDIRIIAVSFELLSYGFFAMCVNMAGLAYSQTTIVRDVVGYRWKTRSQRFAEAFRTSRLDLSKGEIKIHHELIEKTGRRTKEFNKLNAKYKEIDVRLKLSEIGCSEYKIQRCLRELKRLKYF